MKFRFFIVGLFIILCFSVYLFINSYEKNVRLREQLRIVNESVVKSENDRNLYFKKENELNDLKEKNRDKISKYEEVKKWNEEIIQYLD